MDKAYLIRSRLSEGEVADLRQRVTELEAKLAQAERRTNELLCVIHRDGGHYISEHGPDKAYADGLLRASEAVQGNEARERAEASLAEVKRAVSEYFQAREELQATNSSRSLRITMEARNRLAALSTPPAGDATPSKPSQGE